MLVAVEDEGEDEEEVTSVCAGWLKLLWPLRAGNLLLTQRHFSSQHTFGLFVERH